MSEGISAADLISEYFAESIKSFPSLSDNRQAINIRIMAAVTNIP